MKYELAKELKDAGFRQLKYKSIETGALFYDPTGVCYFCENTDTKSHYNKETCCTIPTLSELIEACGGKFGALMVGPGLGLWTARGSGVEIHAESPIEAVAKLWLDLNKKS